MVSRANERSNGESLSRIKHPFRLKHPTLGPEEDGLDTEEEGPEDVPEEESPEREPLEDESSEEVPIFARHSEGSTRPRRNIQVPIRMIE